MVSLGNALEVDITVRFCSISVCSLRNRLGNFYSGDGFSKLFVEGNLSLERSTLVHAVQFENINAVAPKSVL